MRKSTIPSRRGWIALAASGLAVAGAVAGAVSPATADAPARASAPVWGPCPDLGEPAPGVQCATLEVPLDYANPNGRKIQIAVSRLPSGAPSERRGVLFLNPGGTNRSELAMPARLVAQGMPEQVRGKYDLVTFDPRGVGRSTPVTCDLEAGQYLSIPASEYARNSGDMMRRAKEVRTIAQQCGTSKTAYMLPHMTTANVARDMDRIRAALGESRISYLGYSYGTYLGAVYATLFPQRTDRVVLDSVVGPRGMDYTWSRRLAPGVEERFPDFARWAAERNGTYRLGSTAKQVRAKYFELAGRLDRRPAGSMDGPGFRYLTFAYLFSDSTFPYLADLWRQIDQGGDGVDPGDPNAGADFSGMVARSCGDGVWSRDVGHYRRTVELDRARYPMFGASGANIWPCAFWPVRAAEPPVRIGSNGPSNILLVSNLRDPGTPWAGAAEMRAALGQRARLLSVDRGGHLVYLSGVSECADTIVSGFLATGERPATDRRCD